jgi:hypothetical protein
MSDLMQIRPVGGELFHADRRTDMIKLIVDIRNFAIAPKDVILKDVNSFKFVSLELSSRFTTSLRFLPFNHMKSFPPV